MEAQVRRFRNKHPAVFGGLIFVATLLLAILTILSVGSLYVAYNCSNQDPASWAGAGDAFFLIQTSPMVFIWCGISTYCAIKCKPVNTVKWLIASLALYGSAYYRLMASSPC